MANKNNQFQSGNYNSWDKLVKEVFPKTLVTIRKVIIPKIDSILNDMLGQYNSEFVKQNIDVNQIFNNNQIDGINCDIEYIVNDFQSPNVPNDAVQHDIDIIKNALASEDYEVKEVKIDTSSGKLDMSFEILFEDMEEDDQTRISQKLK